MARQNAFSISVLFRDTKETFSVKDVTIQMTIGTLKTQLEVIAGIPKRLQRLMYLDEGECIGPTQRQRHGNVLELLRSSVVSKSITSGSV